jgi:hypothetical protein
MHARFEQSKGVKLNGILECKFPSKTSTAHIDPVTVLSVGGEGGGGGGKKRKRAPYTPGRPAHAFFLAMA